MSVELGERIAVVETEVRDVQDDVREIRNDIRRLEGALLSLANRLDIKLQWLVGLLVSILVAVIVTGVFHV